MLICRLFEDDRKSVWRLGEAKLAAEVDFNGMDPFKQVTGHTQHTQQTKDEAQVEHGAGKRSAAGLAGALGKPGRCQRALEVTRPARVNAMALPLWILWQFNAPVRQQMEHLNRP